MAGSAKPAVIGSEIRTRILADPALVLDDGELMRALIGANDGRNMGANVVDLRGLAMERLEARLARLEETHRAVISAAYENLSGTNQIHRAVLMLLDAQTIEEFLHVLSGQVADLLRVDAIRLVLETAQQAPDASLRRLDNVLTVAEPGFVSDYMSGTHGPSRRQVLLRQCVPGEATLMPNDGRQILSEAMLRLDLGTGRLPGMLVMGSEDAEQFRPGQGTDLLAFFAGVFERTMRRWLA